MKTRIAALTLVCAAAAGCGGSKPISNAKLATDLQTRIGSKNSLVCWTKSGDIGGQSAMGYTRVCGLQLGQPSVYVRTGTKNKAGYCVVTPRYNRAPDCGL